MQQQTQESSLSTIGPNDDVWIILSGGGAKGAIQAGALVVLTRFLQSRGLDPKHVMGVTGFSVGCIQASKYVESDCDALSLVQLWRRHIRSSADIYTDHFGVQTVMDALSAFQQWRMDASEREWVRQIWRYCAGVGWALYRSVYSLVAWPLCWVRRIVRRRTWVNPLLPLFQFFDRIRQGSSLYAKKPIARVIAGIDFDAVRQSSTVLEIFTLGVDPNDQRHGHRFVFSNQHNSAEELHQGVLAGISLPGMFPPERIGGGWFVDPGNFHASSVQRAIDAGAQHIFFLSLIPRDEELEGGNTIYSADASSPSNATPSKLWNALDGFLWWNDYVSRAHHRAQLGRARSLARRHGVAFHHIRPDCHPRGVQGVVTFKGPKDIGRMLRQGALVMRRYLDERFGYNDAEYRRSLRRQRQ